WRNGKLTQRWFFDSDSSANRSDTGQGCHNLRVGDVDADGYDEIVYGSCTIDHNGKGLYNTKLQHGDALHLSDMDPDRTGLEVWQVHEDYKTNGGIVASFRDAKDGTIIKEYTGSADNGRGMAAPVVSGKRGWQMWSSKTTGLIDISGNTVSSTRPSSINFGIWWDGDLLRELEDSIYITKYGGNTLLTASGCASNNSTKSTPCLTADIFGDWREELILRNNDNTALYIYTTTAATAYRLYTLMHDPIYRMSVASENVAYNQPPEPGIYINYDMTLPEVNPAIQYYDGTVNDICSQSVCRSRPVNSSVKVMADRSFVLPVRFNGMSKSISIYDCSGKMIKRAIVKKDAVNLRKDFGLSNAMYIVKVDAVSENLIK
ncbi:MAG TPA: hypothetical protein DCO75_03325, partial [Fibrobacteres bacterium]|nr:hypothetical protein [Fibrobacterota bacterium]